MADLEDMLLEAAGRANASGRKRQSYSSSRRRREGSYSDQGSDFRDDDSDDDRGYASRKPSGSQVPLKKRFESSERDDDQGSLEEDDYQSDHERGSSDSNVGSDLYKNEDDWRKLAEMSELQREMILLDRADKKEDRDFKDKIRLKRERENATQSRKQTPPLQSRVCSSTRSADKAAAKDGAALEAAVDAGNWLIQVLLLMEVPSLICSMTSNC